MRLVEFEHTKKNKVYVNPEFVIRVAAAGLDKTYIYYRNNVVVVRHDVSYVVSKLTEENVD